VNTTKQFRVLLVILAAILSESAAAQDTQLQRAKDDFVSPWIVTIDSGTLVLAVTGVHKKSDNLYGLDASFGFVGNPMKPVEAEIKYTPDMRQLKFATSSGIRYQLILKPDGSHQGEYAGPRGAGIVLAFDRVTESELQSTIALGTKKPEVVTPGQDVPKNCSTFSGSWKGNWNGDANLWITTIDKDCLATYLYAKKGWRTRGSAKIQNQKLEFQAARATFEFSFSGPHILGTYRPNDNFGPTLNTEFTKE
jgi:hypothetical protein